MTLATVPSYDPDAIGGRSGHAVVVGASMAGLLAARVLTDRFETVTVVEKDILPDDPAHRPGTPQARHIHVLQQAGQETLDDLFPGFSDDVTDAGGLVLGLGHDVRIYQEGGFLARCPDPVPQYTASRAVIEQLTRRRVRDCDGVTIRDDAPFTGYLTDDEGSTIGGVRVRAAGGEREIAAEVVVDATGRSSRTPAWLEANGFQSPPRDEVTIDLTYSTVLLDRPTDRREAFLVLPDPPRTRGAAVFPIEDGRWLLTLAGMHGDEPPRESDGFADYADSLPVPDVCRLLEEHPMCSGEIHRYPFPSSIRRRYEALDRFPDGLLVVGDAVASFNPIYGQGMSVAALEAVQLHHVLASSDLDDVGRRFFERAAPVIDDAWRLSVGSDFQFPQTRGPKPAGTDLVNRYVGRLLRKAHGNGRLTEAFAGVVTMQDRPSSLFHPRTAWRVLRPGR